MELRQLEAVLTVAQLGSFSRAAERLYLTQPSLTARVQALERELGVTLFLRGRSGAQLTEAGRVFLPYVEEAFHSLRRGQEQLVALAEARAGRLVVGSSPSACTYVLPPILQSFVGSRSRVEVVVRTGYTEEVQAMVLGRQVEVGIAPIGDHPELERRALYDDEMVCIVAGGHPLARRGAVSLAEVAAEPLILYNRPPSYRELTRGLFVTAGLEPTVAMELDNVEATLRMVEAGLGVAFLPWVAVEREVERGTIARLDLVDAAPVRRRFAVAWRRSDPLSPVGQAFVQHLLTAVRRDRGLTTDA